MIKTKKLSSAEQRKVNKINKQIEEARQNKQCFIDEERDLKKQLAVILCPFSIGDEVIRDDGKRGKVSKIMLAANSIPVFSVFTEKKRTQEFSYNFGEHYRTKSSEVWNLLH